MGKSAQLMLTAVTWCGHMDFTAKLSCVVRCSWPRLLVCISQQKSAHRQNNMTHSLSTPDMQPLRRRQALDLSNSYACKPHALESARQPGTTAT